MNEVSPVARMATTAVSAAFSEAGLLLLAFVLMALAVTVEQGHYSPGAISLLGLSAVALVGAARRSLTVKPPAAGPVLEKLLALALVFLLVAGTLESPGYHLQAAGYRRAYIIIQLGLAVAVTAGFLLPRVNRRVQAGIFITAVGLGLGLRVGMIFASPAPVIDVFTQFQESAAHLLQGLNPFTTPVSDPYAGSLDFGYRVAAYSYPPASLYLQTPFYFLWGDIRYAYIAAELVALGCLYTLVAPARRTAAALLVLLFLFHPRGLFAIEQAWNEPLLVGAAAGFLWLAARRPDSRWVPVACGFFLSLKQYLVFFAVLFFFPRQRWRLLPVATAVVGLTWLPFLLWDAPAAVENGLLFQFRTPFRPDGLTLSAVFYHWLGWMPTKWVAIAVGALVAAVTGWCFRGRALGGYLYASLLTTLAVFLAGSQAFCNYYYFLGALLLFLIALRLRETSPETATAP